MTKRSNVGCFLVGLWLSACGSTADKFASGTGDEASPGNGSITTSMLRAPSSRSKSQRRRSGDDDDNSATAIGVGTPSRDAPSDDDSRNPKRYHVATDSAAVCAPAELEVVYLSAETLNELISTSSGRSSWGQVEREHYAAKWKTFGANAISTVDFPLSELHANVLATLLGNVSLDGLHELIIPYIVETNPEGTLFRNVLRSQRQLIRLSILVPKDSSTANGDAAALAVACEPNNLRELAIEGVTDEGVSMLMSSDSFADGLVSLKLTGNFTGASVASILASAKHTRTLTTLHLHSPYLEGNVAAQLAGSPLRETLRELGLNKFGSNTVDALMRLTALTTLSFDDDVLNPYQQKIIWDDIDPLTHLTDMNGTVSWDDYALERCEVASEEDFDTLFSRCTHGSTELRVRCRQHIGSVWLEKGINAIDFIVHPEENEWKKTKSQVAVLFLFLREKSLANLKYLAMDSYYDEQDDSDLDDELDDDEQARKAIHLVSNNDMAAAVNASNKLESFRWVSSVISDETVEWLTQTTHTWKVISLQRSLLTINDVRKLLAAPNMQRLEEIDLGFEHNDGNLDEVLEAIVTSEQAANSLTAIGLHGNLGLPPRIDRLLRNEKLKNNLRRLEIDGDYAHLDLNVLAQLPGLRTLDVDHLDGGEVRQIMDRLPQLKWLVFLEHREGQRIALTRKSYDEDLRTGRTVYFP